METSLLKLTSRIPRICKRDLGIFVPVFQKVNDPIQQLFLDKLREYKSKSGSGKLVDPSPELEKELKNDRERVCKQFGVKPGQDYTKFPSFTFKDPELESPGLPSPPK